MTQKVKKKSTYNTGDPGSIFGLGRSLWERNGFPFLYSCLETSSLVQSLSHVWLFATLSTVASQASLFITNSWSLLKLRPIESVMPFNRLILSRPLHQLSIFPVSATFLMSQIFASGGLSMGASASASVLPMNSQDLFPLGFTCLVSLQSKGISRVFSNTTVLKHQFFSAQLSLWCNAHFHTWLLEKP